MCKRTVLFFPRNYINTLSMFTTLKGGRDPRTQYSIFLNKCMYLGLNWLVCEKNGAMGIVNARTHTLDIGTYLVMNGVKSAEICKLQAGIHTPGYN